MMFSIFAKKKSTGQVSLEAVKINVQPENVEDLFSSAVKKCATADLEEQIKYILDCKIYSKEVVDQTIAANKHKGATDKDEVVVLFPKAMYTGYGVFKVGDTNRGLARVLAKEWINENYTKVA